MRFKGRKGYVVKKKEKPQLPEGQMWTPETIAWFNSWRNSPRSDNWDECQWQYVFDTAIIHNFAYNGDVTMFSELNRRLAFMGLNFDPPKQTQKAKREVTQLEVIMARRKKPVAKNTRKTAG